MNNNPNFLNETKKSDLFQQLDEEKKKSSPPPNTNDEFINSLPDWDLPPLFEKIRRVKRQ